MSNALKKAVNAMEKSDSGIANNIAANLMAAATTLNNAKHTLEETTAQVKQMIYNDFYDLTKKVESGWTSAVEWTSTNIIKPVKKTINGMVEDYNNCDKYNESEEKVLESNYFSSYKGVPVFRIEGKRSGSFGAIFLTRKNGDLVTAKDVVRHEYGHTRQLKQLGVIKYALCIGLPSWQNWGSGEYYDKPWEITADIYGGVESRVHLERDIKAGYSYLEASKFIGPLVWIFIEQEEEK